jgi:hypothetical protein
MVYAADIYSYLMCNSTLYRSYDIGKFDGAMHAARKDK